jgi:flagellar basal-body rod modification protein FlgD
MANLDLLTSNTTTNSAWASAVPTSIKTTTGAADAALKAGSGASGMGQKDFLTLFTTQLKNQDPLDPVKNEAFVAQLAQFSQLEATTGMAQTLTTYVNSMSGQTMMNSASLIGKKVSVPDAPALFTAGRPVLGIVNLPNGADGITFNITNSKGVAVAKVTSGAQIAGDMTFSWNGTDDAGSTVPDGLYRITASAVSQGKTIAPSVSTLATVIGVSQQADQTMLLQVQGGKTVKLADVKRIDG